jgi:hypothetical protein
MFKIDSATSSASAPTYPSAGTPGHFTKGNPGSGIAATLLDDWWLDQIENEIANVITGAGITLAKGTNTQLLAAIQALVGPGVRSGLSISNDGTSPNTKRNITASLLSVSGSGVGGALLTNVSVTINSATSGAGGLDTGSLANNTVYYEYVIAQAGGANPTGLMSLSATAPTLPSGYVMSARVGGGAITDASSHFYRIKQAGDRAQYIVTSATNTAGLPVIASGAGGTPGTPTFVAASIAAFVPATAQSVIAGVNCGSVGTGNHVILVPNSSYSSSSLAPINMVGNFSSFSVNETADLLIESTNLYYASDTSGSQAFIVGWRDKF